jgi:hypothetical protein
MLGMAESNILATPAQTIAAALTAQFNFPHLKRLFRAPKYGPLSPYGPAIPRKSWSFGG